MSNSTPMSMKERLFHSILFEMGAVCLCTVLILLFSQAETGSAVGVSVLMSIIAMLWNFAFNYGFDKIFTEPREHRSFALRLGHTMGFEGGLLVLTLPLVAYFLQLSLWQAFLADIALSLVVMVYTLIFNWIYDHVRLKWIA